MKFGKLSIMILAFGLAMGLAHPVAAHANTIGPTNCGSCDGNSYTMTYFQTAAQVNTTNYTIQLIIDTSGYNYGANSAYLMSIAPGIPGWSNAVLTMAPGGTSKWSTTTQGGLNASGCDSSGTPYFCNSALSQGSFNEVGSNTPLEFQWTLTDASLPTGTDGVSLKAYYTDSSGNKVGSLLSEDMTLTTTVPEPSTAWLMGTGLLGLAWFSRRRLFASS